MKSLLTYVSILLCLLSGCGGGSEGTGTSPTTTRTLAGTVTTTTGAPLANADITLLETGDSTKTDERGAFSLSAPLSTQALTLEVSKDELSGNVVLSDIDTDSTSIDVALVIDERSQQVTASSVQLWSRIIGDCDRYFENRAIIRQSVVVEKPITCTMRFFASGGGKRLPRVRGEMEVRACNSSRWRKIAEGATGFGVNAGFGDIEFTFIDNQRNCEYRVAAPVNFTGTNPLYIYLQTLTLQGKAK